VLRQLSIAAVLALLIMNLSIAADPAAAPAQPPATAIDKTSAAAAKTAVEKSTAEKPAAEKEKPTAAAEKPATGEKPKNILLLGQTRDHPAGAHEYMSGLYVLAKSLEGVPNIKVTTLQVDEPAPEAVQRIKEADAIVLYVGEGGRWMQLNAQRLQAVSDLAARGGGIVGLHFGIGAKDDKYVPRHLELMGGMHGGSDRIYVMTETDVKAVESQHPIMTGVEKEMRLDDEYYYHLKFAKQGTVTPLLQAKIDTSWETIAWAYERPDGGRSFGFGGMHYHKLWENASLRRLIAQGILWTLKLPIPKEGLPVKVAEDNLKVR
jgi:type 1 glutamine amidotransferase